MSPLTSPASIVFVFSSEIVQRSGSRVAPHSARVKLQGVAQVLEAQKQSSTYAHSAGPMPRLSTSSQHISARCKNNFEQV